MKRIRYTIPAMCLTLLFACSGGGGGESATTATSGEGIAPSKGQSTTLDEVSDPNILQVAIGSEDHTTLVAAVQAAELEDVLANNGPLTVFAPVNSAFDALPEGTVENLLKPENKGTLSRIIKFHAAPGTYTGDGFKDGSQLFMASGHYVSVENKDGVIKVNGAQILGTVEAANGVVHVVDVVFLPPDEG